MPLPRAFDNIKVIEQRMERSEVTMTMTMKRSGRDRHLAKVNTLSNQHELAILRKREVRAISDLIRKPSKILRTLTMTTDHRLAWDSLIKIAKSIQLFSVVLCHQWCNTNNLEQQHLLVKWFQHRLSILAIEAVASSQVSRTQIHQDKSYLSWEILVRNSTSGVSLVSLSARI